MRLGATKTGATTTYNGLGDQLYDLGGARPTLDLNFASNGSLVDSVTGKTLVTHTRASNATYVDGDGIIKDAVTNLQRYSEDFTQGLTPTNATLTADQGVAPNGTQTADQFIETTANGLHSQEIVDHVFVAGTTYVFSCYAKSISGRNFAPGFPTIFGAARFGYFNLSGSGSVVSANAGVTASIQAVGDGWYRCSITSTCVTGGGARVGVFIADGTSISYTGDTAKGLLLWGAQLEQSSTAGEYVKTTSTINSAPRFDHNPTTGESLGLLVEESRTNIVSYSEEFDNSYWGKVNATIDANAFTAPDGTLTADTLIPAASSGEQRVRRDVTGVSSNTTYTLSVYAKAAGYNFVAINHGNYLVADYLTYFNLNTGTVATNAAGNTASITDVGNGWYRCSVMRTTSSSQTVISSRFYVAETDGVKSFTGDGTSGIYLWGAQLEAGSFPTSYIRTNGSTVTRSADVTSITGTNFSSWYNQTEGTVFANCNVLGDNGTNQFIYSISDGVLGDEIRLFKTSGNDSISSALEDSVGGITSNIFGNTNTLFGTPFKTVHAFAANYAVRAINGINSSVDNTVTVPAVNQVEIGARMNGTFNANIHLSRLTYWPTRLSNDTLQTITR